MRTVHVGTGSTRPEQVRDYPYRPTWTVGSIADLVDLGSEAKPLLADGRVQVNGETETRRGRRLVTGDVVTVLGERGGEGASAQVG